VRPPLPQECGSPPRSGHGPAEMRACVAVGIAMGISGRSTSAVGVDPSGASLTYFAAERAFQPYTRTTPDVPRPARRPNEGAPRPVMPSAGDTLRNTRHIPPTSRCQCALWCASAAWCVRVGKDLGSSGLRGRLGTIAAKSSAELESTTIIMHIQVYVFEVVTDGTPGASAHRLAGHIVGEPGWPQTRPLCREHPPSPRVRESASPRAPA
jgi:hypothetical protein